MKIMTEELTKNDETIKEQKKKTKRVFPEAAALLFYTQRTIERILDELGDPGDHSWTTKQYIWFREKVIIHVYTH